MGHFSWKYCDSKKRNGDYNRLKIDGEAYIPLPKDKGACGLPPGCTLYEPCYDGYGNFSGYDLYDIVADLNKEYLTEKNLRIPKRAEWGNAKDSQHYFEAALKRYQKSLERLHDFQDGESDYAMELKYGRDWKRMIGIDIACYDDQNAALKYPIKVCRYKKSVYENLPASLNDPDQGL